MSDFQPIVNFIKELYHNPYSIIPLHAPIFMGNEKEYLNECIDSTFVSSVGKYVDKFEEKMAEYTGAKKAVACVNGTNAIHIALKMVGVEKDTEVITQPLTFVATANSILYCDAHPVFIDVDPDTMGLSPFALKNWLNKNIEIKGNGTQQYSINKRTGRRISACLPMHTFGHPVRISEIVSICKEFFIPVVEDATESLGSFYKKQHTGTFGKIGVLSFNGNKILTSGGGGMLLFSDETLAIKAKHLTTQAKVPHPWEFVHDEIGYNYRMPNINAALGLAQLEQIGKFLVRKRLIADQYNEFFAKTDITFISEPRDAQSNYWLNCVMLKNKEERDAFLRFTNSNGVMTRPAWRLMNKLPMFLNCTTDELKNSMSIEDRIVNIPSSVI